MPKITVSLRDWACACKGAHAMLAASTATEQTPTARRLKGNGLLMLSPVSKKIFAVTWHRSQ
jgi:hypothetical protein